MAKIAASNPKIIVTTPAAVFFSPMKFTIKLHVNIIKPGGKKVKSTTRMIGRRISAILSPSYFILCSFSFHLYFHPVSIITLLIRNE